jgi:hypothetical protein
MTPASLLASDAYAPTLGVLLIGAFLVALVLIRFLRRFPR